jgi:uncharacterized protein YjbI with pentapeptide repeats
LDKHAKPSSIDVLKIVKPDAAEVLVRVFSNSQQQYCLSIGLIQSFALHSSATLPAPHTSLVYAVAAEALGKNAMLDEGLPKACGEFLLYGAAYPPVGHSGQPLSVKVSVGGLQKQLAVFGDRTISTLGLRSAPATFSRMPLTPANAYGGKSYPLNPQGKGADKVADPKTTGLQRPMPNVELPDQLMLSATEQPAPAGYWAFTPDSPTRAKLLGRFNDHWLINRWPHLPTDTQADYFQTAPADQRLSQYFRGDEAISLHNLHPQLPFIETALPKSRGRIFVEQQRTAQESIFKELTTHIETVWLLPDQLTGLVLYRAVVAIEDSTAADIKHVYTELEPLGEPPKSLTECHQALAAQTQSAWVPEGLDSGAAAALEESATVGTAVGAEVSNNTHRITTGPSREQIIARHARGESFANEDLSGIDLSGLNLLGADFSGAQLAEANFSDARLEQTNFDRALLSHAVFVNANLVQASMVGASAGHVKFTQCDLSSAILKESDFSHGDFTQAKFNQSDMTLAIFSGSKMQSISALNVIAEQTSFEECSLADANFSHAQLKSASFHTAILTDTNFTQAACQRVDFSGATLSRALFANADLQDSEANTATTFAHCRFTKANLSGVSWAGPCLDDAAFDDAVMDKADITGASLHRVRMPRVLARQACFANVDLTDADLTGINLFEGSLANAKVYNTHLRSANLFGVNFMDAKIVNSDLSGSDIERTILGVRQALA